MSWLWWDFWHCPICNPHKQIRKMLPMSELLIRYVHNQEWMQVRGAISPLLFHSEFKTSFLARTVAEGMKWIHGSLLCTHFLLISSLHRYQLHLISHKSSYNFFYDYPVFHLLLVMFLCSSPTHVPNNGVILPRKLQWVALFLKDSHPQK